MEAEHINSYILPPGHHVCTDPSGLSLFSTALAVSPMITSSKHGASNIRPLGTIRIVGTKTHAHNIRVATEYIDPHTRKNDDENVVAKAKLRLA